MKIPASTILDARIAERNSAAPELERALAPHNAPSRVSGRSAFTMVEIALCLAIIGFALVAIIGVLPMGMNVQTRNRQETIINEDAVVWMDSIRNGARQDDDLAASVLYITNYWTTYDETGTNQTVRTSDFDWYGRTNSRVSVTFGLTNGFRVIGLLSMPKIVRPPPFGRAGDFQSNYLVAYVRGMSGPAVEKIPQNNLDILANAFTYRLIVENSAYVPQDPMSIDYFAATNGLTPQQIQDRHNNFRRVLTLQTNCHDLRLTFRWPVYPTGVTGPERQTFRILTGGSITNIDDSSGQPLYFLQPSIYLHARALP